MEAYLAADVSKGYADFVLLDGNLNDLENPIQFDDSRSGHDAFKQWLNGCINEHDLVQVWAGMESTGGFEDNWYAMLFDLSKTLPVRVCRLNPMLVTNAAKAEGNFQHTDSLSAYQIGYYQRRYHDKITYGQPDTHYRSFRSLDNHIQLLLRQRTQLINELKQLLYRCLPELLVYSRNNGIPEWMLALLQKYPSTQKLARARAQTLAGIAHLSLDKAQKIIDKARQSVTGQRHQTDTLIIQDLVTDIQTKILRIDALKQQLADTCSGPEVELLQTIKGVGAYSASRIMIHIEDIRRFASAKQLASYFGLHPTIKQSGDKTGKSRMSKRGRAGVRSALFMCAKTAVIYDPHMKAIFEKHKADGKNYFQAIGVIMHKMLRIMWGILTNKTSYNSTIDQINQQKTHQKPVDQMHKEWQHKRRNQGFDAQAPISRVAYKKRKVYQLSQVSIAEQVRDLTDIPNS